MALTLGSVVGLPLHDRLDLVAPAVAAAAHHLPRAEVFEIDPDLADTAALCAATGMPAEASGNCVIVAGRRGEVTRYAACVVLASTRADVNSLVRKRLDARKASFADRETATSLTGMEYGGITPVGLPPDWLLLIDAEVAQAPVVCVGSGVRSSKLLIPGADLADLPNAEVLEGLGLPA